MPLTIPRNTEMEQRARELYVPRVFGIRRVAEELGISATSVARYVNPEYRENNLRLSREAKTRRIGVCARCGGETRYNGRQVNGPSATCRTCNETPWTHCAQGHELTGENDLRPQRNGWTCRICRNKYARENSRRRYAEESAFRERKRIANARYAAKRKLADSQTD